MHNFSIFLRNVGILSKYVEILGARSNFARNHRRDMGTIWRNIETGYGAFETKYRLWPIHKPAYDSSSEAHVSISEETSEAHDSSSEAYDLSSEETSQVILSRMEAYLVEHEVGWWD